GRRLDVGENLAVRTSHRLPVARIDEVDARPHHVLWLCADLGEGTGDDLEAPLRLLVRIARARPDRRRAGDVDVPAVADGARVADDGGHRRDRRDELSLHLPSIA